MSIKNVSLDSINKLLTPMHNDINEKTLLENLTLLITDREKLAKLQGAAMKLAKYDGVDKIVKQLENLV